MEADTIGFKVGDSFNTFSEEAALERFKSTTIVDFCHRDCRTIEAACRRGITRPLCDRSLSFLPCAAGIPHPSTNSDSSVFAFFYYKYDAFFRHLLDGDHTLHKDSPEAKEWCK